MRPKMLSYAVAGAVLGMPVVSYSQGVLEEIVVTATKREASLADTAIAITAISSEQRISLGIYTAQDVANITPSMSFQQNAGGGEGNRIYLRGIGRETNTTGTEPGVGVYDNGFYANESAALAAPIDLTERIEILRGPQGTLFGRNTTGGAVNVVTKKPGAELEHIIRGRLGNYDRKTLAITSSGPINDTFGYLVHYSQEDADSFTENVSGPDPIGTDIDRFEAQLSVNVTDGINWNLRYFSASFDNETFERAKLDGYRNEGGAPSKLGEIVINPELFSPLATAPDQIDPFKRSADIQGFVKVDDQETVQSTLTIDLDSVTIKLLNGYQDYSWDSAKDFDGTASPASFIESVGQKESMTQHELQLFSTHDGPLQWLVGLFYLENELDQPYVLSDANNPFLIDNLSGAPNPDGVFYSQRGILEAESTAVYGQIDWELTDRLSLSMGLRYSEDDKKGQEFQTIFYDSVLDFCGEARLPELIASGDPYFTPPGCFRLGALVSDLEEDHEESWSSTDFRLNASYDVSDAGLVYATFSSGYKPGGFRLGGMQDDPETPENESTVANEEVQAYELGYKGVLSESFSISTALFFYDYEDMQVELDILDPNSGIVTSRLANAPEVDIFGVEFEGAWAVTDKLSLLGNYSYLSSEYKADFFVSDNKNNEVRNVRGNELNRTPNRKWSISAIYRQPIAAGDLTVSGNYSWIGEQYVTVFNDAIETIDNYGQLNARVSWRPANGLFEIALYGQNLSDELSYANAYSVSALADGIRRTGTPINPRTYGLEAAIFF